MRRGGMLFFISAVLMVGGSRRVSAQPEKLTHDLSRYYIRGSYIVPDDTLYFACTFKATDYEVVEVSATVDGVTYPMKISSATRAWVKIPLVGKEQGEYPIIFTATDFGGGSATDSVTFRYDFLPHLQIVYPRTYDVGTEVRLRMKCVDDPAGPCSIKIYHDGMPLFTTGDDIDTVIDFPVNFSKFIINIVGVDAYGQKDSTVRITHRFKHPEIMIPCDTFDLSISGISEHFVEGFANYKKVIQYVCNRKTKVMTSVDSATWFNYDNSFIAMVKPVDKQPRLMLVFDNAVDTIADSVVTGSVRASKKYVVWRDYEGFWRYSIETRERIKFDSCIIEWPAVSSDGDVYYLNNYMNVCHFNGDTVEILDDRSQSYWFVYTNGPFAIWGREGELVIYDHKKVHHLPSNPKKVIMRDDFVAFDNYSESDIRQIFYWTPDERLTQITGSTSTASFLVDISPDRYLLTTRTDGLYLDNPKGAAKKVFDKDVFYNIGWYGDNFYASVKGVLYTIDTTFPSTPLTRIPPETVCSRLGLSVGNGQLMVTGLMQEERVLEYSLFDVKGHRIKHLRSGRAGDAEKGIFLDITGITSGIYLARVRTSRRGLIRAIPVAGGR